MALWYDMRCSWCGYESEIGKRREEVVGCTNPEKPDCPGIMEVQYKTPPALTRAACPSREERKSGVRYTIKEQNR